MDPGYDTSIESSPIVWEGKVRSAESVWAAITSASREGFLDPVQNTIF